MNEHRPRPSRRAETSPHQRTRLRLIARAWQALPPERRLAAGAALALFVTLFLPWYQETVIPTALRLRRRPALPSASLTGWAAFSFVEAAVLLVAAGVLVLLFIRAEGRAFHVPGGDGGVITAAGFWTSLLIVWRMFDKEGTTGHGQYVTTSGIEWGIFIALGVAVLLAYAGTRIRLGARARAAAAGRRPPAGAARGPPRPGVRAATPAARSQPARARAAPRAGRRARTELRRAGRDRVRRSPRAADDPAGARAPTRRRIQQPSDADDQLTDPARPARAGAATAPRRGGRQAGRRVSCRSRASATVRKYTLTRPITRMPVRISARDWMMCPNTPTTTPKMSTTITRSAETAGRPGEGARLARTLYL